MIEPVHAHRCRVLDLLGRAPDDSLRHYEAPACRYTLLNLRDSNDSISMTSQPLLRKLHLNAGMPTVEMSERVKLIALHSVSKARSRNSFA